MTADVTELLRRVPVFAEVPADDLGRLVAYGRTLDVPAGQVLLREGAPPDALYVVLDGRLEARKRVGSDEVVIGGAGPGEVVGEMALLASRPRFATVVAARPSRVLEIGGDAVRGLLTRPPVVQAMLRTTVERLELTEDALRVREKLAALGELTAGLLHNLNNPASVLQRVTGQLEEALDRLPHPAALASAPGAPADLLARGDREEAVEGWLEDRGVDRAWELAADLVAQGWDTHALDELAAGMPPDQLPLVVPWVAVGAVVRQLATQARVAAARVSEIVAAVQRYSRHDRAPVEEVDVHEGLESTLVLLDAGNRVTVTRDYARDLPRIEAFASELHQVWANLIGNALDALGGSGELTLRTRGVDGGVAVEVIDTGPGYPPEAAERLFDPFFTTKAPGSGTGLGLWTVWRAVVDLHGGQVTTSSQPGHTVFRVELPTRLARPDTTEAPA